MSLAIPFSTPWFTGDSTGDDARWDVMIGGHGYMVDRNNLEQYGRQTVPMIRQQSDTSDKPAEASLNPAGLWRRSVESWDHGAGQDWLDKPDSDPRRFNTSKGVNPWTKYGLTLLPAASLIETSTDTNLFLATASGRLYMSEGQNIRVTGVGDATFGNATGEPAAAVTSLTSDGTTAYAAFAGTAGIYTATGTVFAAHVTTLNYTLVRYAMGRLIGAVGNVLYNPIAAGASPGALYTHPNTAWTWTDATEGRGHIYLSGYSGDVSMIYRTAIKADGTALDIPVVAGRFPEGEIARSVTGYLGYLVIGTDKGVRFAISDDAGNLTIGSLIETASPVYAAEGQDRFVWYGLTNYDATSTGLGRLDLTTFTNDLTPAYASDLMASGQGTVQSVVTYGNRRWFTVSGLGAYQEQTTKVASGTVTSGRITYGIPDTKTAVEVDVRHDPLPAAASVTLSMSIDAGTAVVLGTSQLDGASVSAQDAFSINQSRGTFFEITASIAGDMTLRRVTLRADPAAERTTMYQVPLLFHERLTLPGEVETAFDVDVEFAYLTDLLTTRQVVNYQETDDTFRVVLEDYVWRPYERTDRFWTGTFLVKMKGL